jgi:hypothetical protein
MSMVKKKKDESIEQRRACQKKSEWNSVRSAKELAKEG